MKIAVKTRSAEAGRVIRQLLLPWKVAFTSLGEANIAITYREKPPENMKSVIIPSSSSDFIRWLKEKGLKMAREAGTKTAVAVTPQTNLTITPRTQYRYKGSIKSVSKFGQPPSVGLNDDVLLLTLNVIEEYGRIMDEALNPRPSTLYRIFTGLPIPYTLAPERLRNLVMRRKKQQVNFSLHDKLPLDALRYFLVKSVEKITNEELERKTWAGKRYVCILTHDVDSRRGLKRAKKLKKLEEKYYVPSAWYVPSKQYKLDAETIKDLANHGEIGAHDTKHDGKLDQIPKHKLVRRLCEARQTLEKITGQSVKGFRAPLLQHNAKILEALERAGYAYDTSIPTWEPKHPSSMGPYGIGTVYPLDIDGIVEVPVSLPQDHQMIQVLGLSAKETVKRWLEIRETIRDLGGICTILVHPDYELASPGGLDAYEELLNRINADGHAFITVPLQISMK